ncbi:MAG: TlpA family protein disulfide reductase [Chloroflexi bacterium]|nr:TlpA family protein disulfide reductase [Chloroflexota bacterium]
MRILSLRKPAFAHIAVVALLLGFISLFGFGIRMRGVGPVDHGPAPAFTLQLFDGESLSLAGLQGKVAVINFWASWCVPCRQEAPILEKTWQRYRAKGVVFIGVAYIDTEPEARAFLKEFKVTYPNGPDLGTRIAQAYRIRGVPETYFVDKNGQVTYMHIGPLDEGTLTAAIERLLATAP